MRVIFFYLIVFTFFLDVNAQVGIGNTDPAESSLLDVRNSTNDKGILIPRVNIVDLSTKAPITSTTIDESLLVYNTNTTTGKGFYFWDGSEWVGIESSANKKWLQTGNSGINSSTDFIGTTDANDLVFRTNNLERFRINSSGFLGINSLESISNRLTLQTSGSESGMFIRVNPTTTGSNGNILNGIQLGNANGIQINHSGNSGHSAIFSNTNTNNTSSAVEISNNGNNSSLTVTGNTSINQSSVLPVASFIYNGTQQFNIAGVWGIANGFSNIGVLGTGDWFGVFSIGDSGASGTKQFLIDHPTEPEDKFLRHYSIESNEVLNIYRGIAEFDSNGNTEVVLPDYYEAINKNPSYQLTPIGAAMPNLFLSKEILEGVFKISGGVANKKVSWQITAERNDLYMQNNEDLRNAVFEKEGSRKGKYVTPSLYSQPEEKGLFYRKKDEPEKK